MNVPLRYLRAHYAPFRITLSPMPFGLANYFPPGQLVSVGDDVLLVLRVVDEVTLEVRRPTRLDRLWWTVRYRYRQVRDWLRERWRELRDVLAQEREEWEGVE